MMATQTLTLFTHALLFVLGFSLVFIVGWGGAATLLGQIFGQYKSVLSQVGGAFVLLFGLHTLGLLRVPWLDYDLKTTVAHALNHQKILAENRRLADQVRAQQEELARQRKAIEQLEQVYPGITRVVRDQDDAIILAD